MKIFAGVTAKDGKFYVGVVQGGKRHLHGPFTDYEGAVADRDRKVIPTDRLDDTYDCWALRFPRHAFAMEKLESGSQSVLRTRLHEEATMFYLWEKANEFENPKGVTRYKGLRRSRLNYEGGYLMVEPQTTFRFNGTAVEYNCAYYKVEKETIRQMLLEHRISCI